MIRETYGAYRFFSGGDSSSRHFSPNGLGLKWIRKLLGYRTARLVNQLHGCFYPNQSKKYIYYINSPPGGEVKHLTGMLRPGQLYFFICYYSTINILNSVVFIFKCFICYFIFSYYFSLSINYFFMCICHFFTFYISI